MQNAEMAAVKKMIQNQTSTEEDLLVDLTFHGFSSETLKEFCLRVVKPYFHGNLNLAVKGLMEKAIADEECLNAVLVLEKR